jgi:hypothetical protein
MFTSYKKINADVLFLVAAEISLQLVNTAFLFILLIYMQNEGFTDYEGAHFVKVRFLTVLLVSIPLGYYVKGKKIIPLFYISSALVPVSSLALIYAIEHHHYFLLYTMQITWGIGFVFMMVSGLPYILRNSSSDTLTQSISLSHIAWSAGGIISGAIIFSGDLILGKGNEKLILQIISCLSFISFFFILQMKKDTIGKVDLTEKKHDYDWKLIFKAMMPTAIIAIGAGLTIPFISLFFVNIHQISSGTFALAGTITLVLVTISTLFVPEIKSRWGFKKAVPVTQSLAVATLILLALTELMPKNSWIVFLALFLYIVRQPLMNLAAPMTSEVTMLYVGEKNREMASALTSSIWSGSWFFSAQVFEYLRKAEMRYYIIFLMTALLYSFGIIMYYRLISDFEKQKKQ